MTYKEYLKRNTRVGKLILICGVLAFVLISGCAKPVPPPAPTSIPVIKEVPLQVFQRKDSECRSSNYVVVQAKKEDTYQSLAIKYLKDERLSYLISDFNNSVQLKQGNRVMIPLRSINPGGINADGYQTIPVLCYHRFSKVRSSDKITVSEETFDRQMAYLKHNDYTVITLQQLDDFIESRRTPPKKSVLITIDDGVKGVKNIAYPILKKYGFSAVAFIIADYVKTKPNSVFLNWDELKELKNSGNFEIENHSASHRDLTSISEEELELEIGGSKQILAEKLNVKCRAFAFPYGLFNNQVIDMLRKYDYKLAFTVIRGGNGSFFYPWCLRRSMVYNSDRIEDFTKMLTVYNRENQ